MFTTQNFINKLKWIIIIDITYSLVYQNIFKGSYDPIIISTDFNSNPLSILGKILIITAMITSMYFSG